MFMPQFFIKQSDISGSSVTISEKDTFHHLVKVLRVKKGEKILFADENQTQYETEIVSINENMATAKILRQKKSDHFLNTQIYLAQCVLKNDAQTLVIQKSTELGVKGIIPVLSDNVVIKSSVIDSKIDKWRKIAFEAVKQCERTDCPVIFTKKSPEEILKDEEYKIKIACVEREQKSSLKTYLRDLRYNKEDKILVITGPEGGFSKKENELFDKYKVPKISLGKLILKAETAVIAALSSIILELES
jgi:16S rRNA (uracil1498-N3)-methyltransferase